MLKNVSLIILCAGNSTRFKHKVKKQWLRIDKDPLWLYVSQRLEKITKIKKIIIASHKDELKFMQNFKKEYTYVQGGNTRQASIKNCLEYINTKYVMRSDVARVKIPKKIIQNLINEKDSADCIVPILDINDTVIYENSTINREKVKLIQTPQISKTKILKQALKTTIEYTDESSAIKANNGVVKYIKGSLKSQKITFKEELKNLKLKKPAKDFFTGYGFDTHKFIENKTMFLGGIKIPFEKGFLAHSDGDVLLHSLIDALLGAAALGDIGEFFPDNNLKYKDINSQILLKKIINFINHLGYEIINIDCTIIAQKPKITPFKDKIKNKLSELLKLNLQYINIKATTSEKMGYIGRQEGVSVHSVATLKYYNWKSK